MTDQCRFCASPLAAEFADLGMSPVSNELRPAATALSHGQTYYPLRAMVCETCWLVQLTHVETPEHFTEDYVYFSSFSQSWLDHAKTYAETMTRQLALDETSLVVELASNDGYLLQYFKRAGVPVLGIDPTANTAEHAKREHGIDTVVDFFGEALARRLASEGVAADLIAANNVLAHVPDPRDFLAGVPHLLKAGGTFTIEFPHLLRMIELSQFDTIYHEHFSYLSLRAVETMAEAVGLRVYGVEELGTHGGSLRVFCCHADADVAHDGLAARRDKVRAEEETAGLGSVDTYRAFAQQVVARKADLLEFLIAARRAGKSVAAYGAPAKGATMLNYCGAGPEFIDFTVDISPHKQGHYLPGVNIPIHAPERIDAEKPDYILILPWNLRAEIVEQLAHVRDWGGKFVVAIPELEVF